NTETVNVKSSKLPLAAARRRIMGSRVVAEDLGRLHADPAAPNVRARLPARNRWRRLDDRSRHAQSRPGRSPDIFRWGSRTSARIEECCSTQ
ncbi:MAG: hypothetical protein ACRENP_17500, partial [Longimicrobiales bacterium]